MQTHMYKSAFFPPRFQRFKVLYNIFVKKNWSSLCLCECVCVCECVCPFVGLLCALPLKVVHVCAAPSPVIVLECFDPQSSDGGKGPYSCSQEPSANHFLSFGG